MILIILLVSACSTKKKEDPKTDPTLLFEDTFQRADGANAGATWQEVKMRNGNSKAVPLLETGDSPWSIKGNTLYYEAIGNNTYTEDYIQTVKEFPVNNTKVEFELRATAATSLGYVGPAFFWAPAASTRLGSFQTTDGKDPVIGVAAFYSWESSGTKGLVYYLNGKVERMIDGKLGGVNTADFVKHTITVKDGKLIHEVAGSVFATYSLDPVLTNDAKRHFSFDVRYYDNGKPFKVEIRNLKITAIK